MVDNARIAKLLRIEPEFAAMRDLNRKIAKDLYEVELTEQKRFELLALIMVGVAFTCGLTLGECQDAVRYYWQQEIEYLEKSKCPTPPN